MIEYLTADPSGLQAMAQAVEAYCSSHGLTDQIDRNAVAVRVLAAFANGAVNPDQILAELLGRDGTLGHIQH